MTGNSAFASVGWVYNPPHPRNGELKTNPTPSHHLNPQPFPHRLRIPPQRLNRGRHPPALQPGNCRLGRPHPLRQSLLRQPRLRLACNHRFNHRIFRLGIGGGGIGVGQQFGFPSRQSRLIVNAVPPSAATKPESRRNHPVKPLGNAPSLPMIVSPFAAP